MSFSSLDGFQNSYLKEFNDAFPCSVQLKFLETQQLTSEEIHKIQSFYQKYQFMVSLLTGITSSNVFQPLDSQGNPIQINLRIFAVCNTLALRLQKC